MLAQHVDATELFIHYIYSQTNKPYACFHVSTSISFYTPMKGFVLQPYAKVTSLLSLLFQELFNVTHTD